MRRKGRRQVVFPLVLACLVIAALAGCRRNEPVTSWDSPRLAKIEKQWRSLRDTAKKMSDRERTAKYGEKYEGLDEALAAIIERNISKDDMRRLVASCDSLGVRAKDRSEFQNAVLSSMVWVLAGTGDRDSLVRLLSTRCPVTVFPRTDIEFVLVMRGERTLKYPILILGEAFGRCKNPIVRRQLADAVRRGFRGYDIAGKDDADFVKNAMKWYEENKDKLTVNGYYFVNADAGGEEAYERHLEINVKLSRGPKGEPLFQKKNKQGEATIGK
jgi:hypothetical protein